MTAPKLPVDIDRQPFRKQAYLIFALITTALLAGGYVHYRIDARETRQIKCEELAAIGTLKAGQIERWMKERQMNATRMATSAYFQNAVADIVRQPKSVKLQEVMRESLQAEMEAGECADLLLLAPDGRLLCAAKADTQPAVAALQRAIAAALAERKAAISVFYRNPDGEALIDIVAAVHDADGQPLALLVMRRDPQVFLFPMLYAWPLASFSGESVLSQQEDEEVVFVNPLRHATNAPMTLRFPLTRTNLPAVQAALGREGIIEGIDYRGVPVLTDVHHIRGTSWTLIAKIDSSETYAEARFNIVSTTFIIGTLILLAAAGLAFFYQRHQVKLLRKLYEAERRELEVQASLLKSDARWQFALEGSGAGVWDWNVATGEVFFSRQWKIMLGFEEHEIGNHITEWESRAHPEDMARCHEELENYFSGKTPAYVSEHRMRCKDGSYKWILDRGKIVERTADGKPLRVIGLHEDITARKRAEQSVKESEERLRILYEQANDGIFLLANDGRLVSLNQAFAHMHGYSVDEMSQMNLQDLDTPDTFAKAPERIARLLTGESLTFEVEHYHKDGHAFPLEVSASMITDDKQKLIQCSHRDITERKQMENYTQLNLEILQLLNGPHSLRDSIKTVIEKIKAQGKFDAVGIRLEAGEDFPYFAQQGFSKEFLRTENSLLAQAADGGVCRNPDGSVCLECTCGLVLAGKTDPTNQLFTPGGSCWINDSFPMLEIPAEQDPRLHPRNVCIHHGYASVALIPIRYGQKIVGLLQVNDRRKGRFTLAMIRQLEELATNIGHSLMRQRAEAVILESETRYRTLFERASDGILIMTADGKLVSPNTAFARMHGYSVEEMSQMNLKDLHTPETFAKAPERIARLLGGETLTFEVEQYHKDGHTVRLEVSASPMVLNGQGLILSFHRDITERRAAEASLRLRSAALEAAANAIVITNPAGEIEWVNTAFTTTTGYSRAEVIGQNPRVLKSGKQDAAFYQQLWATLLAGDVWHGELINRRKDGSRYTEDATITPLKDSGGEITHYIGVKQDITQRKSLEAQFLQVQKMEAFGRLAGGVAHDFNNLIGVIHGNAELIKKQALAVSEQGYLQEILDTSDRASTLTRQLLTFSRRNKPRMRPLDLNHILGGMGRMLQRIIGEDIELQMQSAPEAAMVTADAGMIEQVVMNLAVNARDAMPHGGQLSLTLESNSWDETVQTLHPLARPGDFIHLRVRDSGSGIAPEVLPHIFEPFYTTKSEGRGTGLGLATVQAIVAQHQGWVEVENEESGGASFHVYLPRLAGARPVPTGAEAAREIPGGTETILLVEDETRMREIATKLLKSLGYQVIAATSGVAAMEQWREYGRTVDLLLTDLVLPEGITGQELAGQLQTAKPGLKVIYMSGYPMETVAGGRELHQAVNFLHKPFSIFELGQIVRDCLDAPRTG